MEKSITVILNAYKRLDLLQTQLDSINEQSFLPSEIYIWNNSEVALSEKLVSKLPLVVFDSSKNLGVWARFSVALNSKSNFIAVLDDDTIPGKKWFENCLKHIGDGNRLLGTRGLRFLSDKNYSPFESYGWDNPNEELIEVDIIGHSWFFEKKLLTNFWSYNDIRYHDDYCGEDIHLSYSIQRSGFKSYVPPHKLNDLDSWGSLPKYALEYGTSEVAISYNSMALNKFTKAYIYYISKNFQTYYMSNKSSARLVIKTGFRETKIFNKINKEGGLYRFLKNIKKAINSIGIQF